MLWFSHQAGMGGVPFAVLLRGWMDVAAPTHPPASVQRLVTRGIHDHRGWYSFR